MQRFEEFKELFMAAIMSQNWKDVIINGTELLTLDEKLPWVWCNRGIALQKLGHPFDAIMNYNKSLEFEESAIAYCNKGAAYYDLGQMQQALKWYDKALEVDKTLPEIYMNFGHVYKRTGQNSLAIQCYKKSVEANDDYADGHLALGMMLLKDGQYKDGWHHYEKRWKTTQLVARQLKCPQWNGKEDLSDKSILVYGEQGLGDIIQFGRFAEMLAKIYPTAKVIVEGRQPTKRLLQSMPSVHHVINYGEKLPHLDYAIPMLTLGGILTPSSENIYQHNYHIDDETVEAWANRFDGIPENFRGFNVGICWAGLSRINPDAAKIDSIRSTTLQSFAPLANVKGVFWVSLQKGKPSEEIKAPPRNMNIADFTEDMWDFYETCGAIKNCDLVITVDTAVAHAAASIGKKTWVLNRYDGCWRWLHNRTDSPWYPSVRLFNQEKPNDWDGLMGQLAVELAKEVAK